MKNFAGFITVLCLLALVSIGEAQTRKKSSADQSPLAAGEKIFKEKQCGTCHISSSTATMKAPDLTSVFTAFDTTFVKVHLRFQEETAMPPISLNAKQTEEVARYVSHLHAEKFQKVKDKQADGKCPVCGALLKISDSAKDGLLSRYNERLYYFECKSCKEAFDKNPAWHLLRWQDPTSVINK
jgi:mono/diheme cytochrome c family protein